MTVEEQFKKDIWWMLQRIKRKSLETPKDEFILIEPTNVVGAGIPGKETQINLIKKFIEWEAIKPENIVEGDWKNSGQTRFEVSLVQPKFDRFYKKYEIENDLTSYLDDYDESSSIPNFFVEDEGKVDKDENKSTANIKDPLLIKESLLRKYSSIINLPEKGFFQGIADYIKYLDDMTDIDSLVFSIVEEQNKAVSKIEKIEQQVNQEINETAKKLFKIIARNKIKTPELVYSIGQYQGYKDGSIQSTAPYITVVYEALDDIFDYLNSNGYGDLVKEYAIKNKDGNLIGHRISEAFDEYRSELKEFQQMIETSIWGAWSRLVRLYHAIHNFNSERARLKEDIWRGHGFYLLHEDWLEILKGDNSKQRIELKKDDYLVYFNRVHDHLIDRLTYLSQGNEGKQLSKKANSFKLQYYPADGLAEYKDVQDDFKGKGRALLDFLNENKNTTFGLGDIQKNCNPNIHIEKYKFKKDKDIWDTVDYIRKKLKVKPGEYFPIQKRENNWIWIEK